MATVLEPALKSSRVELAQRIRGSALCRGQNEYQQELWARHGALEVGDVIAQRVAKIVIDRVLFCTWRFRLAIAWTVSVDPASHFVGHMYDPLFQIPLDRGGPAGLLGHGEDGRMNVTFIIVRAVLAVALMIGFYALALGIAFGLLWVPYAEFVYAHLITPKLALICVLSGVAILWSVLPRRDRFSAPGR
jgi:hypothetical protein